MLSDTRYPRTGPRERASYRAVLWLDISMRSVFTICHLSHHWDCQCFNACVKYKAHPRLSSLVVNEDLPWKPSDQSTLIQGPKWGAWSTDFKPSLSLLTASLHCAWGHIVKVWMGDYSLQVNRGSLLFFFFWFPFRTGHRLVTLRSEYKAAYDAFWWGWTKANLSEHLVAMLEGGRRAPSWSLLPKSYDLQLILRCEFLPLCDYFFWPWSRWCQDLFWKEHYVPWWPVIASWPLACCVAFNKSLDLSEPQFHYRMSRLDENESSLNPNRLLNALLWIAWNKG